MPVPVALIAERRIARGSHDGKVHRRCPRPTEEIQNPLSPFALAAT
jgi:hypothetical protein